MKESLLKTVTRGNPHGETLFVFHGWAMNSSVWQAIKSELEKDYLVTWVDLPGHGINSHVTAKSLDQMVELILPLVKTTRVKTKSHLMGWSLGGLVAQALAEQIPNQILSLNLVATSPRFSMADGWLNAVSKDVLETFSQKLTSEPETTIKGFITLQFMGVKGSKKIQRDLINTTLTAPLNYNALAIGLTILGTADFRHVKHSIPQHWILGEYDRLIPKNVINDLKLMYPDAQITLLENTGHALFMTHPNEFIDCFRQFMKRLESPAKC